MSASGAYDDIRVAAGIVGNVDLRLGDAAGDVLDAHIALGAAGSGASATGHPGMQATKFRTSAATRRGISTGGRIFAPASRISRRAS